MNQIQVFNHPLFGELRTIDIESKTFVVGNDVAKALEYSRPYEAVSTHCKGAVTYRVPTNGGLQEVKVIPEGDVYRLIVKAADQSRNLEIREKAEIYERWVFDEVLPSIRKHGMYATDQLLNNPDLLIAAGQRLKEEQEARKRLELQIEADRPKVIYAEALETSTTSILVRDLAKILKQNGFEIGGTRMFAYLRENGYLIKQFGSDYNMPTQKSMELGLFEIKTTPVFHNSGKVSVSKTPKVTAKGQQYFIKKFLVGAA